MTGISEGVDYSPEGIEQLRQELIKMRNYYASAGLGPWTDQIVILTHAIAILAYTIELIKGERTLSPEQQAAYFGWQPEERYPADYEEKGDLP